MVRKVHNTHSELLRKWRHLDENAKCLPLQKGRFPNECARFGHNDAKLRRTRKRESHMTRRLFSATRAASGPSISAESAGTSTQGSTTSRLGWVGQGHFFLIHHF